VKKGGLGLTPGVEERENENNGRTCEGIEERSLFERVVETVRVGHEVGHLEFDDAAEAQRNQNLLVALQAHQQTQLVRQHVTVRDPVHHLFA